VLLRALFDYQHQESKQALQYKQSGYTATRAMRGVKGIEPSPPALLLLVARGVQDLYGIHALKRHQEILNSPDVTASAPRTSIRRLTSPAPVGHSYDLHLRGLESTDKPERKSSQGKPTMLRIESRSQGLLLAHARARTLDLSKKFVTETWHLFLLVGGCRAQFGVRSRVKFNLHRRFKSARALARTLSTEIPSMVPASSSRLRRCAYQHPYRGRGGAPHLDRGDRVRTSLSSKVSTCQNC